MDWKPRAQIAERAISQILDRGGLDEICAGTQGNGGSCEVTDWTRRRWHVWFSVHHHS
jgi:hypothetical protein